MQKKKICLRIKNAASLGHFSDRQVDVHSVRCDSEMRLHKNVQNPKHGFRSAKRTMREAPYSTVPNAEGVGWFPFFESATAVNRWNCARSDRNGYTNTSTAHPINPPSSACQTVCVSHLPLGGARDPIHHHVYQPVKRYISGAVCARTTWARTRTRREGESKRPTQHRLSSNRLRVPTKQHGFGIDR